MTDGFWERGPLRRALYYGFGRWGVDVVERLRLHGARVAIKAAAAVGVVAFVLWVFLPIEVRAWRLWMGPEDAGLAAHIAMSVVGVALLIGMLGLYARQAGRVALARWSILLGTGAFLVSLLSSWNYLIHQHDVAKSRAEQARAVVVSAPADELQRFDAETSAMLGTLRQALAEAPADAPTGRSRLTAQITSYIQQRSEDRVALVASLDEARARSTAAAPLAVDPRPLDGVIASVLGASTYAVSVVLDLARVIFLKAVLFLGIPLSLTLAPEVKRDQDKRAAAAARAKQQPRADGKWASKRERPRLVHVEPTEDEEPDPTTPAPTTAQNAGIVAGLFDEIAALLLLRLETRHAAS